MKITCTKCNQPAERKVRWRYTKRNELLVKPGRSACCSAKVKLEA